MEKITKYSQIVMDLLQVMATDTWAEGEEVHEEVITDTLHHHYFIIWTGFGNKQVFMNKIMVHFQIKENGKIWILANWTENDVAAELIYRGVERNDIVIGFYPQNVRTHTGYAAV